MIHRSTYLVSLIVSIAFFSCSGSPDINSGDAAFNKGDYSAAVTGYTESLQTNPSDLDLL